MTHIAQDDIASAPRELRIPVDWSGAADVQATPLNQFICQVGAPLRDGRPDGIYLLFGNIVPPLVVGDSQEERQRFIDMAGGGAKVQIHGRYVLSRERLDELIDTLQKIAEIYDSATEAAIAHAESLGQED